jgi:hypothetical protein
MRPPLDDLLDRMHVVAVPMPAVTACDTELG